VTYIRKRQNVGYRDAVALLGVDVGDVGAVPSVPRDVSAETCAAPCEVWQDRGMRWLGECHNRLWSSAGDRARSWLNGRGVDDDMIAAAGLGFNDRDVHEPRESWGLPVEVDESGRPRAVWLPRGVVIPWWIGGELWRLNVRRAVGRPKYIGPAGWSNGLYGADGLRAGRPVVVVEGEVDALTVQAAAGDLAAAVALGSTSGARRVRWLSRLAGASRVLVVLDDDGAGDGAADWWLSVLGPVARRWRVPWGHDSNGLQQQGGDVRGWIAAGLGLADAGQAAGVVWAFPG
jgi:hypothetical protein